jgi:hypothetical protein
VREREGKLLMRLWQNDREKYPIRPKLMLLEFDERFAVFKDDFSFYDYKQPIKLDGKAPQQWLDNRNADIQNSQPQRLFRQNHLRSSIPKRGLSIKR